MSIKHFAVMLVSLLVYHGAAQAAKAQSQLVEAMRSTVDELLADDPRFAKTSANNPQNSPENGANLPQKPENLANSAENAANLPQKPENLANSAENTTKNRSRSLPAPDLTFVQATSAKLRAERQLFASALLALQQGSLQNWQQLQTELADYPLLPFLDYSLLSTNIASSSEARLSSFAANNADNFMGSNIRTRMLNNFYQQGEFAKYLQYSAKPSGTANQCRALNAKLKSSGATKDLPAKVKKLYLHASSQPNDCDVLFSWYLQRLSTKAQAKLIQQRLELSLAAGNYKFAKYLLANPQLPSSYRQRQLAYLAARERINAQPELIVASEYQRDSKQNRQLALLAVNATLRDDLPRAEQLWGELKSRYKFSEAERGALLGKIAKRAAQRHLPDALSRFYKLPASAFSADIYEWQVRAALRALDWQAVRNAIRMLPKAQREAEEWRYWLARAEQHVGSLQVARLQYEQVASSRSYYGFLAAERLAYSYSFNNKPSSADVLLIKQLLQRADVLRLREWVLLGKLNYARVELARILKTTVASEQVALAHILFSLDWYEQGIRIMAKLRHFDDLPLRFALAYRQHIVSYSKAYGIAADWAQAIMRRESSYAHDARSRVGATGLMQLMPRTAASIAKRNDWEYAGSASLTDPETNIRFGTNYLAQVSQEFAGQIALATAAYNAGPSRVKAWLPSARVLPLDVWIATIPYPETRKYVQAVSEYMSVFKWRAAGEPPNFKLSLGYTAETVAPAVEPSAAD